MSANTLRSWERRFGFPRPRRTAGGHRHYELAELEALRHALLETHSISAAVQLARARGEGPGPSSTARLVDALGRLDEQAADRVMEESLALRALERSVEELLLPSIAALAKRRGGEVEHELGCRWATGWLHAARRLAPRATRREGVLLLDAARGLDIQALHAQALELALRRAAFPVLRLSASLPQDRVARALRALAPVVALVLVGGGTRDDAGRLAWYARHAGDAAHAYECRHDAASGGHGLDRLGARPTEAVTQLVALVEGEREVLPSMREEGAEEVDTNWHSRASA